MSFQAMTWATEQDLPAMQKIVLLMMANRTNHETGLCYPSHERLAKDCGMTKRSLIQQINKLEDYGLVEVIRSTNDRGTNNVNKYKLNLHITKSKESSNSGSELHSPGVVNYIHPGSEPRSPGVVNYIHPGSELHSPKPVIEPVIIEPVIEPKDTYVVSEKTNNVSVQDIVNLYHNTLPNLPKVLKINEARKKKIKALCKEDLPTLESWGSFFETVSQSKFLMGKTQSWAGCDFEWLINPANALKVAEGRYRNKCSSVDDMSWMEGLV